MTCTFRYSQRLLPPDHPTRGTTGTSFTTGTGIAFKQQYTTGRSRPHRNIFKFAFIVGIDIYESSSISNLVGAVADANAFQEYLQKELGVPSSQIRNLRNAKATRTAIIDGIKAFATDTRIEKGDSMVYYHAGHGSLAKTPKEWLSWNTDQIELLIPHDHSSLDGNPLYGIPDRTLGILFSVIAREKGNNITVILDSCYSSSGTRGKPNIHPVLDHTFKARSIDVKCTIPSDIDQGVWGSRASKIVSSFDFKGLRSHNLLAASHSDQLAYERFGRGVFTLALIETLVKHGIDNLTYANILSRMLPLSSGQSPQCEGFFLDRPIFGKVSDKRSTAVFYGIRSDPEGKKYVIDEGEAAGITVGAEFEVYQDQDCVRLLGTVEACELNAFSTTAYAKGSTFALYRDGVALKSRSGREEQVRVYVADERLKDLVKRIGSNQIQLVERDQAQLSMALENKKVVIDIYDSDHRKHGSTCRSHRVEPTVACISHIIRAAAHFYFHCRRTPQTGRGLAKKVKIELGELEEDIEEEFKYAYKPVTACDGLKDLNVQTDKAYAWTIYNKGKWLLYPALFYFDFNDLSITPYYLPPIAGAKVEAPLKDNGKLAVGYGNSGSPPHMFKLREGQNVDVGVIKLFLSRDYVNLSHVAQSSPFNPEPVQVGGPSTNSPLPSSIYATRALELVQLVTRENSDPNSWPLPWDTVEIPVVQRNAKRKIFKIPGLRRGLVS